MSTLTVTNIQATGETASRAVSGVAAAWVLYDQTNNTNRGSSNISSISDTSTGLFTLSFSSNMSSGYYSTVGSGNQNRRFQVDGTTLSEQTAGSVDCRLTTEGTSLSDITTIGVNIHGDLA